MCHSLIKTSDLSMEQISTLLHDTKQFLDGNFYNYLKNQLIVTCFFENSTRTKSSFEIASKRLGAEVVHLDVARSSTNKGETLLDTIALLNAMGANAIIIRHEQSGTVHDISQHIKSCIINAGDGAHAHPTQALLDLFTIFEHFNGSIKGKRIAIIGDIKTSRVANSNIKLLQRFGLDITLVAPPPFMPKTDLKKTDNIRKIIDNIDIIMALRTQTERHKEELITSIKDYISNFCITSKLMGNKDILLLHPGPVNRNIDIDDDMLADHRCKVLQQVSNGVAMRMAVLKMFVHKN